MNLFDTILLAIIYGTIALMITVAFFEALDWDGVFATSTVAYGLITIAMWYQVWRVFQ